MTQPQLTKAARRALRCGCVAATLTLGACATTVEDSSEAPTNVDAAADTSETISGGTIIDPDAPTPTVATTGSAADLLPDLSTEMSRLGSEIAEGGDSRETLARIEQIWERVQPEIATDRPDLIDGFEATIDMARVGVERKRPADADKGFQLLTDLVDRFFES